MEEHYRRKHSEIRVSWSTCGQYFNQKSGLHRHRKEELLEVVRQQRNDHIYVPGTVDNR